MKTIIIYNQIGTQNQCCDILHNDDEKEDNDDDFHNDDDQPMTQVRATGDPASTWYSSPPWMYASG